MSHHQNVRLLVQFKKIKYGLRRLQEVFPCLSFPQVPNIAALLSDESEHIDWRRLLLSAALPWPSPSVPQLLVALESFKAVDTDLTGYVNEEQYLQVCDFTHPECRHFIRLILKGLVGFAHLVS